MKKGVILLVSSFILVFFILNLVTAATQYRFLFSGSKTSFEEIKTNFPIENPFLRTSAAVLGVYIFGMYNLEDLGVNYSIASIVIFFVLIWLILFVGFSDILHYFSPFSPWASWIIGFAISVIAANIGIIQWFVSWVVTVLAVLGTIAIFIGIILAFAAFVALSYGSMWAVERKAAIEAHRGRVDIAEGMRTFAAAGREAQEARRRHR
jgi:hypothetical protein